MQERKTGVKVNPFAYFRKSKMRSKPDPLTGSSWVSPIAEARCVAYESKFKEVKGDSSDPSTEEFDVEVAMLAGEGKKGGRLWIGDGLVNPREIPTLRQIRRGRTSDQPQVETRPRASQPAVEALRVCSSSVRCSSLHIFHCNVYDIATTQCRGRCKKRTGGTRRSRRPCRRRCSRCMLRSSR